METQRLTYHPYSGSIFLGDQTSRDARYMDESLAIAAVDFVKKQSQKVVAKSDESGEIIQLSSSAGDTRTQIFSPEIQGIVNSIKNGMINPRIHASYNKALVGDANRLNLSHLQMIKLIPRMLGMPEMYFHLHELFGEEPVYMLEARQPITDVYEQQGPIGRYQPTPDSDLQYAEIKYDLKKYPIRIPTPIEDMFRALLNPHETKINIIQWARGKKHNDEELTQLKTIRTTKNMSKIDSLASGDYHDANSAAGELTDLIADHLTTNHSMITHVAMGTKLFRKWTENTWTFSVSGPRPDRIIQGVFSLPGILNQMVVVDPVLDQAATANTIFAIDKMNGARYGQGPVMTKTYDDNERDAIVTKPIEFFQYLMVDGKNVIVNDDESFDRKFCFKINVAT